MGQEPRLTIRNLGKVIKGRQIVKDLNLELYKGEVFGLIGPNGAGKTTTIKMLVGLSGMTSGEVEFEGQSYTEHFVDIKEHIGSIVENPDLYEYMTGLDQLRIYSGFYPQVDEARIQEVIAFVKMEGAVHKKTKVYSMGMKQRLALAMALLHKPSLLILDEPTNGLDPQGIRELRILLRELAEKEGVTVLVSSHILGEMQALCDRVGLIHQGELLKVGKVSEIATSLGDNYVRILVSEPTRLWDYLVSKNIGVTRNQEYLKVRCDRGNVNSLLQELMSENFQIYALEEDHGNLEDSFMTLIQEKGGKIQ